MNRIAQLTWTLIFVSVSLAAAVPCAACRKTTRSAPWWSWQRCERIALVRLAEPQAKHPISGARATIIKQWKGTGPGEITFTTDATWSCDDMSSQRFGEALVIIPPGAGEETLELGTWEVLLLPEADETVVTAYVDRVAATYGLPDDASRAAGYFAAMMDWSTTQDPVIQRLLYMDLDTSGGSPWAKRYEGDAGTVVDVALRAKASMGARLMGMVVRQVQEAPTTENTEQLGRYLSEDAVQGAAFMVRPDLATFLVHQPLRAVAEHYAATDPRVAPAVRVALAQADAAHRAP
jgi:hypothetical protein